MNKNKPNQSIKPKSIRINPNKQVIREKKYSDFGR